MLENLVIKKTWKPKNRNRLILTLILVGLTLFIGVWGIISFVNANPKKVEKGKSNGGETTVKIDDSTGVDVSEDSITIPYLGKNYRFYKAVATEEGILFSNSKYRFVGNKWERLRDTLNGDWSVPEATDIPHLLKVLVKKGKVQIIPNETANPKKKTGGGQSTKPDDDNGGDGGNIVGDDGGDSTSDNYWIALKDLTDEQLNEEKKNNRIDDSLKPKTKKGREAKENVKGRLKAFN